MWPAVDYEELPWHMDPDERLLIPKSRRRAIGQTYHAAVPAAIAERRIELPLDLFQRIADLGADLARFDESQKARGYDLPALLLRSESAASSQIENLTSSVRNVALAELSADAPQNARIIAGNLAAMRAALTLPGEVSRSQICAIHAALMEPTGESFGGELRQEQVWVGGTAYSPHGALYVPPAHNHVAPLLDDLSAFANRDDVNALAKAAVFHAQFESIHPFIDGNGRTGRALLHRLLKNDGVLTQTTLPVSAGLLHDIDTYMDAIAAYQAGDPLPIIASVVEALEVACAVGRRVAQEIDEVMEVWRTRITERSGSAIHRLPTLLAERPVVTVALVAERMGITPRAAANVVERACSYGMLRSLGGRRRGMYYQADELIDILEAVSSMQGIRRILAGRRWVPVRAH